MKKYGAIVCSAFGVAMLLGTLGWAQQTAKTGQSAASQAQPVTTIRSTTRLVQVSVVVTDKKGEPITGLKKEDFAILDENKQQQIAFFSEATPAPVNGRSLLPKTVFTNRYDLKGQDPGAVTVVLFDLLNSSVQDQAYVRKQVIKFLGSLKPQDHVAVYGLTSQLLLLHDFTQDASALAEAASKFKPRETAAHDASEPDYFDAPALDNDPMWQQFQARVNNANAMIADQAKIDRAQATAYALTAIADHVATIPGRKNLVWVSGAFPLLILPDQISYDRPATSLQMYADQATEALNRANVALYPVDSTGVMTTSSMDPSQRGNSTSLTCMDCSNKGPSPHPAMFDRQNSRNTERLVASATGGEAFYGSNDIIPAMQRAFNDGRYAYTIGFYPDHAQWNGKFRKIKVETKTEGAKLRYRAGYFAIAEDASADQSKAKAALQEAAASPLDATGLGMIVSGRWSGPATDRKVEFHLGIDPKQLLLQEQTNGNLKGEVDLFFVQNNDKGEIIAADTQRVNLDLEQKQYEYLTRAGLVMERHETLAPEATEIRVLARDTGSAAVGSVTISVPALTDALNSIAAATPVPAKPTLTPPKLEDIK